MRLAYLGSETNAHLMRWARWAVERGHQVALVTPGEPVGAPAGAEWIAPRWTLPLNAVAFKLVRHRRARELFAPFAIGPVLAPWRPDIVQGFDALYYGWAAVRSVPEAIKVVEPFGSDIFQGPAMGPVERWLLRQAFRRADGVTCNFHGIGEHLQRHYRAAPRVVGGFSWGIDIDRFTADRSDLRAEDWRGKLGIPPDAVVVFNPRGMRAYRGEDNLGFLDALAGFAAAARGDERLHLVALLGDVPRELAGALDSARAELGPLATRVHFLPAPVAPDAMPSLYRAADILLSVPWSDLLSLCVLEGIACGCFPVLAGCPDFERVLVGEQGLRAEIVPPRAPEAIAVALARAVAALEEPVWRERHAALIREHHDARRQEDELGRFYERLAKGR